MKRSKRLLSIQGGGIRGIIPCLALIKLEEEQGKLTRDIFDWVGGTSTGALLASAIVSGVPAHKALDVYCKRGSEIFTPVNPIARKYNLVVHGRMFDNRILRQAVKDTLGANANMTMNDSPIGIMVTAGNMLGVPWYFVRDAATNAGTTGTASLADAATASACATTYHDPWLVPGFGYFSDGGTVSLADPVYQLCVEAFNARDCYGCIDPCDARVVSLGTGYYQPNDMPPPPQSLSAGIRWVTGSLVGSAKTFAEDAVQRFWPWVLAKSAYTNPILPSDIDEADVSSIPLLLEIGRKAAAMIDWHALLN